MFFPFKYFGGRLTRLTVCKIVIVCVAMMSGGLRTAAAETIQCLEIKRLPAVINKSGIHCLKRDLIFRPKIGAAITVVRNNVVIDFNGHRIYGVPALDTKAVGVRITRRNKVRITNGTIERFHFGVHATGGLGLQVDNMVFDQNRQFGVVVGEKSIATVIKKNLFVRTGGTPDATLTLGSPNPYTAAIWIYSLEGDSRDRSVASVIEDNTIIGVRKPPPPDSGIGTQSFGIFAGSQQATIQRNNVQGDLYWGIGITGASGFAESNRVVYTGEIPAPSGLNSGIFMAPISTIYKNNTSHYFRTAFNGGSDRGGNASYP